MRLPLSQPWPLPLRRLVLEGRAALVAGDAALACRRFETALRQQPNLPEAHLGLALARRPGPDYVHWLSALHAALRPRHYLEIGVESGKTLRLAAPPTIAIGIDPAPWAGAADGACADSRIFATTSQDFFASPALVSQLPGPIDLAFIDGDHRLTSVLHDFIQVEAHCDPAGIIVLHDTWPLDALTAASTPITGFYTGDGWKIVPCLRVIRPDLRIMTIAAPPTGLTVVTGLDPRSTVLTDRFQAIIAAFSLLPYPETPERLLALHANSDAALDQLLSWRRAMAMAMAKSS